MTIILNKITLLILTLLLLAGIYFTVNYYKKSVEFSVFKKEFSSLQNDAKKTTIFADSIKTLTNKILENDKKSDSVVIKLKQNETTLVAGKNNLKIKLAALLAAEKTYSSDTTHLLLIKDSIISNQSSQLIVSDNIISGKDSVINIREIQLENMRTAVLLSNRRGDSLQTQVTKLIRLTAPRDPNKLLGFIPMPSRTVAYIAGVVTGGYLISKATH